MAEKSKMRTRRFMVLGAPPGSLEHFALRAQRAGSVIVEGHDVGPHDERFHGTYRTHGNKPSDLMRMAEQAGISADVVTIEDAYDDPCEDPACPACAGPRGPAAVDAWGLAASGIILGAVQEGFSFVHRVSHGFGDDAVEANRHLLGAFPVETADDWTPMDGVASVFGVPPCSGFSLLNTAAQIAKKRGKTASNPRGAESPINECQRELVRYAARCTGTDGGRGSEFVVFESVQGAYTQGRSLMQEFLHLLREWTGQDYRLTHVLHSAATLGGAQMRSRYFWVGHRVPFGVEIPEVRRVHTYRDAIEDLTDALVQMEEQEHPFQSAWMEGEMTSSVGEIMPVVSDYAEKLLRPDGRVDGMGTTANLVYDRVVKDIMSTTGWEPGDNHETAYRRYIEKFGDMPEGAHRWWNWEKDKPIGFMGPRRVQWDRPGYVLTGGGIVDFIHPENDRTLTVREIARLMGVPDAWRVGYGRRPDYAAMHLGKTCPVQSARWIAGWVRRSLEGDPGSVVSFGTRAHEAEDSDLESVVDVTNLWRAVWKKQEAETREEVNA